MSRNQPDTRVRLSAEGVEEVIAALRRIQAESTKTGKVGAAGFNVMSEAGKQLAAILPTITFAAVIAGAAAMAKQAIDTADSIGKLSQKTGLGAETLSVFAFAARTADLEQQQLNKNLIFFQRTMSGYASGAKEAGDATEQLFGNRKALEGLDDDQRLLRVVNALAKLGPEFNRAGIASKFFGRSGAELLPLIDDLGNGGFDELRKKAEKLGLIIDEKTAAAAQRANDAMTDLRTVADGLAIQFASGLTPSLAEAGEVFVEAFGGQGIDVFRSLGEFSGKVIKGIVRSVLDASIVISQWFLEIKGIADNAGQLLGDLIAGNFSGSIDRFDARARKNATGIDAMVAIQMQALDASFAKAEKKTLEHAKKRPKLDGGDLVDIESANKAAKARLALQEALLQQELTLAQAIFKLRNAQEREAFEQNEQDVARHFAKRRLLIEREAQAEIDTLVKQQKLLEAERPKTQEDAAEREKKLAEIKTKILIKETELRTDLIQLRGEERKAIDQSIAKAKEEADAHQKDIEAAIREEDERINAEAERGLHALALRREAENKLLETQGRNHEARLRQINDEANAEIATLIDNGVDRKVAEQIGADQREANLRKLATEELTTVRSIEQQRLDLQGKRHDAAILAIDEEARRIDAELKNAGVGDEDRSRQVGDFTRAATARAQFDATLDKARQAMDEIQRRRQEIQEQVSNGTLFQFQADEQILEMERDRLPVLSAIGERLDQIAERVGDPALITQAQDFNRELKDLELQTNRSAQQAAKFKAALENITDDALLEFFTQGIDQIHSFGDAFRSVAVGIVQDLRKVVAEMLVAQIRAKALSFITGLFGGAGKAISVGDAIGGGGTLTAATGGLIRGPGTGTSDSIRAMVSPGEYIMPADRVKELGVDFFRWLHHPSRGWTPKRIGGVPHFAEGGLVGGDSGGSSWQGEVAITLNDDAMAARIVSHPRMERAVLKILNKNKKATNSILGR